MIAALRVPGFQILLVGGLAGLCAVALIWQPIVFVALGALAVFIGILGSRRAGFAVLLGAVVIQRWLLPVAGAHVRAEHLVLGILGLGYLLGLAFGRPGTMRHVKPVTLMAGAIVGINILSSLCFSPSPTASMKIVFWLILSLMVFLTTLQIVGREVSLDEAVTWLLRVGAMVSVVGIVSFTLNQLGLPAPFMQRDPITGYWATYATMWEPNLFGSFEMMIVSLSFSEFLKDLQAKTHTPGLIPVLCLALLGLFVSFTRAAWLAEMVALAVQLFLARGELRLSARVGKILVPLAASFGLLMALGAGGTFMNRASTLTDFEGGSLAFRLIRYAAAWAGFLQSPLLGLGTNSFGQRYLDPSTNYSPDYLPSLFLQSLYDTGIVGFVLLMAFFGMFLVGLARVWSWTSGPRRIRAAGFLSTLLAMLIAYQTTSGFWFGSTWLILGLMVVFMGDAKQEESPSV